MNSWITFCVCTLLDFFVATTQVWENVFSRLRSERMQLPSLGLAFSVSFSLDSFSWDLEFSATPYGALVTAVSARVWNLSLSSALVDCRIWFSANSSSRQTLHDAWTHSSVERERRSCRGMGRDTLLSCISYSKLRSRLLGGGHHSFQWWWTLLLELTERPRCTFDTPWSLCIQRKPHSPTYKVCGVGLGGLICGSLL